MSIKSANKQNQRQSKANKPAYDRYRNTAQRERNKMRRLLRHCDRYNLPAYLDKNEGGKMIFPDMGGRPDLTFVQKAWAKCAERTGGTEARKIFNAWVACG